MQASRVTPPSLPLVVPSGCESTRQRRCRCCRSPRRVCIASHWQCVCDQCGWSEIRRRTWSMVTRAGHGQGAGGGQARTGSPPLGISARRTSASLGGPRISMQSDKRGCRRVLLRVSRGFGVEADRERPPLSRWTSQPSTMTADRSRGASSGREERARVRARRERCRPGSLAAGSGRRHVAPAVACPGPRSGEGRRAARAGRPRQCGAVPSRAPRARV